VVRWKTWPRWKQLVGGAANLRGGGLSGSRSERWASAAGFGEQVGEMERRRLVREQIGEVAADLSWSRSERWPAVMAICKEVPG
jgi:hypothetical protein